MLIGVIAELWVLESAKVRICEGIEATPIYSFGTNACTCIALIANERTVVVWVLNCR